MIARPSRPDVDPIEGLRTLPDVEWRADDRARLWSMTCDVPVRRSALHGYAARAAAVLLVATLGGLLMLPGAPAALHDEELELARIESDLERVMARVGTIVHRADTAAYDDVVAVGARLRSAPIPWSASSSTDASP